MQYAKGKYIFLIPLALLLGFTVFKACNLSFTIDESASYLNYAQDTYRHILGYIRLEANNHVINSVLMKFLGSLLPFSELSMRLPSLLAHVVYLSATWLLVKDFKNTWFRLAVYLFLNLNPFMLDFFSLARGYAQSWALMVLSLYFLKRFIDKPGNKFINSFLCFIAASLSALASFPTLNFYLALLTVYMLYDGRQTVINWKTPKLRLRFFIRTTVVVAISALTLIYVLNISYRMLHGNFLYYGGDTGFWRDTVSSLVYVSLYDAPYRKVGIVVLKALIMFVLFGSIAVIGYSVFKRKKNYEGLAFFAALAAILIFTVLIVEAQHYLLGVKYVFERTGGYILVIFILVAAYFFDKVFVSRFRVAAAIFIAGVPLVHFAETYQQSYVYEWKLDASTKVMMKDLKKLHEQEKQTSNSLFFFILTC